MDTKLFATKTEHKLVPFPKIDGLHIVGLDMGYSGPKCIYEDGYFVFPNFCKKLAGELFNDLNKNDMLYEDLETGETYCVGDMAYRSITSDAVVEEASLFGRNHYLHPSFLVSFRTAFGKALWNKNTDGSDVIIQTGLPPAYIAKDSPYLKSTCLGRHHYKLTIGKETKEFDFTLLEENFFIMYQPMGTYYSTVIDQNGNPTKDYKTYMNSNLLVCDGGFGTWDKFLIQANQLIKDTNPTLGMKRVLEETRKLIQKELGAEVSIPAMQEILKSGKVKVMDRVLIKDVYYPISEYLEKANDMVKEEAFESIKDCVFDIKYLIMTGGTGLAWYPYFKERLAGVSSLQVIPGNYNTEDMSIVYANARGYYMYRYMMLKKAKR